MIRYREFVDDVKVRVGLDTAEEARTLAETVVAGLDHWLPERDGDELETRLPAALRPALRAARPQVRADFPVFVQFVAFGTDRTPEEALYGAQAVFAAVEGEDPELADWLRDRLPKEFGEVFGPRASTPPPLRRRGGAGPQPLTDAELADALRSLTDWTGDHRRLQRVVAPPSVLVGELLTRVHRAEREANHHALVERRPDGVAFLVWTHTIGEVTAYDVDLARRIDAVVAGLG